MDERFPQALFLDRDGTLIEWVHYIRDPAEVRLTPKVAEGLALAKKAGCLLFLHTNQSGVARGLFSLEEVEAVNRRMLDLLGAEPSFFDDVCIATEHPDLSDGDHVYRKPSPRFVREMVAKHGLDPAACYFVGDNLSDVETGQNAGINSVLVQSGLGKKQSAPEGVPRYAHLADFKT